MSLPSSSLQARRNLIRRTRQRPSPAAPERLEPRTLMHGVGFEANINFQKASPAAPAGYVIDSGRAFGDRGNGLVYGWDADNSTSARDRNAAASPDQRYDTLTHMQLYGTRTWELAVPNGRYTVRVVGGDPSTADSTLGINVEGALAVSGRTTTAQRWVEGTVTVDVTDGRLTVSNAAGAVNNKINFIDVHHADGEPGLPVVGVTVGDGSAGEAGPNPGTFIVARQGSTAEALTVSYAVTGNATAGSDYQPLPGSVVIPAGASSALVTVNPLDDGAPEGSEGVTLTLLGSASYDLSGNNAATLQIADDDGGGTGFSARVNFQPAGAPVPAGYAADTGLVYGARAGGLSYGWNVNNTSYARDRNNSLSPDQRYDTVNQMQRTGGGSVWEMAVPDGAYTVRVVAGDAGAYDSTYAISVEGVLTVSGKPTSAVRWFEGTRTVQVTDGRLTVTNAAGSANNKIAFIDVTSEGGPVLPQVSIAATDASATEGGGPGAFTVTRTGATDNPLTVLLTRAGSATNNVDYDFLPSQVTFPAGAASVVLNVWPFDDSIIDGTETVTVGVAAGPGYAVGSPPASVLLFDNDSAGTTLAWREVAAAPVGRSEAMGAEVGGKVYVFGGYVDNTFKPTRRADVYDPATNAWTRIADLPSFAYALGGASHVGTAVVGSSIYFAGGYPAGNTSQTFSTTAVFRYDTVANTYHGLPGLPSGRGGGALVALGRRLHFFGGSDSARNDAASHWALDLDNLAAGWVTRASMLRGRNHVAGVELGGKIYAVGGQWAQDAAASHRPEVEVYDPATDRWTSVAPMPVGRSHVSHSTVVRDGKIITLGGLGQGNTVLNKVSSYDPAVNRWTDLTPLPQGRLSGIAGVLPDGRIVFTTGGGNGYRTTTWVGQFV